MNDKEENSAKEKSQKPSVVDESTSTQASGKKIKGKESTEGKGVWGEERDWKQVDGNPQTVTAKKKRIEEGRGNKERHNNQNPFSISLPTLSHASFFLAVCVFLFHFSPPPSPPPPSSLSLSLPLFLSLSLPLLASLPARVYIPLVAPRGMG